MYALRKRAAPADIGGGEEQPPAVDFDDYLDELLEEHEANGVQERAAKRNRGEGYGNCRRGLGNAEQHPPTEPIPLDAIPSPAIESIFDCLNAPRDVHNLAHTCTYMLSHLNARIVIRAAVFADVAKGGDNRTPKVMSAVIQSVAKQNIHVPSASRLLRLLNATRCERGEKCYAYDLGRRVAAPLDRKMTSRPYGLSLCSKCVKVGTFKLSYNHFAMKEDRVATSDYHRVAYEHLAPFDAANGEICGPIIHVRHLLQIDATCSSNDEKEAALGKFVTNVCGEEGEEKRAEYESAADNLVDIYVAAEGDRIVRLHAEERRKSDERKAKHDDRVAKRLKNLRSVFDGLRQHLKGAPLADAALGAIWRENDDDCLTFRCPFVSGTTRSLVAAPAGATHKKIGDAAALIRADLDTLASSDFLDFSFLLDGRSASRVNRALHRYCREELSPPSKLLRESKADGRFVELVREKQYTAALIRILRSDCGRLPAIVSRAYVSGRSSNAGRMSKYWSLAEAIWNKLEEDMYSRGVARDAEWTVDQFRDLCNSCRSDYRAMKAAAWSYLSRPATVAWLDGTTPVIQSFTRQDAVDQVFKPKTRNVLRQWSNPLPPESIRNEKPYDLLRTRNFDQLLEVHQFYFRIGRVY